MRGNSQRFQAEGLKRLSLAPARSDLLKSRAGTGAGCREMTETDKIAADATLDATGLLCPLPVLKARRALKPLAAGAILEILATDPGATKDFEHFCQTTGCALLE